jgi:hypothetical protein
MREDLTPIKLICLMILPIFKGGMKVYKMDVPRKTPVLPRFTTDDRIQCPNLSMALAMPLIIKALSFLHDP